MAQLPIQDPSTRRQDARPHPGSGGDRCRARAHLSSRCRRTNRRTLKKWRVDIRHRTVTSSGQRLRSTPRRGLETTPSLFDSIRLGRSSASGASASARNASPGSRNDLAAGDRPAFPPRVVVAVKALACELPYEHELPLSRWSIPEIKREVLKRGLVASVGDTTLWRWLTEDAIRPWAQRTGIFPRAPDFEQKAGRVLDLDEGLWDGKPLAPADCILSADEKTSIQARCRIHRTLPTAPGRPMRVEHEYTRQGAWASPFKVNSC